MEANQPIPCLRKIEDLHQKMRNKLAEANLPTALLDRDVAELKNELRTNAAQLSADVKHQANLRKSNLVLVARYLGEIVQAVQEAKIREDSIRHLESLPPLLPMAA